MPRLTKPFSTRLALLPIRCRRAVVVGILGLLAFARPAVASELLQQWNERDAQEHINRTYEHAEELLFAFPRYIDYQYIFRSGIERALINARIVAKRYGLPFDADREYEIFSALAKMDPERDSITIEPQLLKKLWDKHLYLENAYDNGDEKLAIQLANELNVKLEREKIAQEKRALSSWKTASSYAEWMESERMLLRRSKELDKRNIREIANRLERGQDVSRVDPATYVRDYIEDNVHQLASLNDRVGGNEISPGEVGKLQLNAYERLSEHLKTLPSGHARRHGLKLVQKKIQYLQYLKHHNKKK